MPCYYVKWKIHICSVCASQGKECRHSAKDCVVQLIQKRVRHCNVAVPSSKVQNDSKGHMGHVTVKMYKKVGQDSKIRTVYYKCIKNGDSVNWRADWARSYNMSYAQVVKQNSHPRSRTLKCLVTSEPTKVRHDKNNALRRENIPNLRCESVPA